MTPVPPEPAAAAAAYPDAFAWRFDGAGGARALPDAVDSAAPAQAPFPAGFDWLHLRRDAPDTLAQLAARGLDPLVVSALVAEETRPRCTVHGDGVLLNLRGVNLDPKADPEDMVSVRLWIEAHRVVGVWVRPLAAAADLIDSLSRGRAPATPGDLIARLALRIVDRAEPSVAGLNERIDALEVLALDEEADIPRPRLAEIRRAAILLRRYVAPQKDALTSLEIEDLDWLRERDRTHLRESAERVARLSEELDSIRDRAQVVHDQIMDQRAERMNRRMLLLAVVSAVFLPLGLIAGMLGMNVGGLPGAGAPWAFAAVCALMAALGAAIYAAFRRAGMLR